MMTSPRTAIVGILVFALVRSAHLSAEPPDAAQRADKIIAIDVLLEPDGAMTTRSIEANARLRENYPAGYTLGRDHAAHISLVHRYVRKQDLPAIEAAILRIATTERPWNWQLTATGYEYGVWSGVAVTTIVVERTAELRRLHDTVVKALEPFAVASGTAAAFSTTRELPKIEPEILSYVANFVPSVSGDKFNPHITVGVAHEDFVKQLKSGPFERTQFKPASVAIYQLGNFGTAQKRLWQCTGK